MISALKQISGDVAGDWNIGRTLFPNTMAPLFQQPVTNVALASLSTIAPIQGVARQSIELPQRDTAPSFLCPELTERLTPRLQENRSRPRKKSVPVDPHPSRRDQITARPTTRSANSVACRRDAIAARLIERSDSFIGSDMIRILLAYLKCVGRIVFGENTRFIYAGHSSPRQ